MTVAPRRPPAACRTSVLVMSVGLLVVAAILVPTSASGSDRRDPRSATARLDLDRGRIQSSVGNDLRRRRPVLVVIPPAFVELIRQILPQPLLELLASLGVVFPASP